MLGCLISLEHKHLPSYQVCYEALKILVNISADLKHLRNSMKHISSFETFQLTETISIFCFRKSVQAIARGEGVLHLVSKDAMFLLLLCLLVDTVTGLLLFD